MLMGHLCSWLGKKKRGRVFGVIFPCVAVPCQSNKGNNIFTKFHTFIDFTLL